MFVELALIILTAMLSVHREDVLAVHYYWTQDLPAALVICAALALVVFWSPRVKLPDRGPSRGIVVTIAALLALGLWAGTYWLMYDFSLTRDEHMVVFDMGIFSKGELAEPLAPEWRAYAQALVPDFLLDVPGNALLVSAYMPGNSMLRAAFGSIADPALMNPLLLAVGLIALHDIARRLFADRPKAIWVVLAAYVLSAQLLVNAMTTYAMTAHIAFNLVWLALFLRGKLWQHALAILLGVWAIGLHQVIFHPLFAGPFILTLLPQRRWPLFAAYAISYAAGLIFWLDYPALVVSSFGIAAHAGSTVGIGPFLAQRVLPLLTQRSEGGSTLMGFNLLRFAAWSPIFIIPCVVMARHEIRANRGVALPLFGGIALTLVAMILLLPNQGHGWGYRYWHPVIGNFSLLAGYGYVHWAKDSANKADGAFVLLAALTALVTLPMQIWAAHTFTSPYVNLERLIGRQKSDFVLIDTQAPSDAIDLVRNQASLANRPIILSSRAMSAEQVIDICRRGTVTLITRTDFHRAGLAPNLGEASPEFEALVRVASGQSCLMTTL